MPMVRRPRRWRGTMVSRGSRASGLALTALLLAGGCQASDAGTALLRNKSDKGELTVVIIDPEGRALIPKSLVEVYRFDTRFMNRELQCLVAEDGHFEVREPDGDLVVSHDFADRPVCEHDVLILGPDGSLTWQ